VGIRLLGGIRMFGEPNKVYVPVKVSDLHNALSKVQRQISIYCNWFFMLIRVDPKSINVLFVEHRFGKGLALVLFA